MSFLNDKKRDLIEQKNRTLYLTYNRFNKILC